MLNSREVAENDSSVELLAHCTFPNFEHVVHKMDGKIIIRKNASLIYNETHFHGKKGGVEVISKTKVIIEQGGQYYTGFTLV